MKTQRGVNQKKVKFIIKESFKGIKKTEEIFADIIVSDIEETSKNMWTMEQDNDIIKQTDNSQILCCSGKEWKWNKWELNKQ